MVATSRRPLVLRILFFLWLSHFTLCKYTCPKPAEATVVNIPLNLPQDEKLKKWLEWEHYRIRTKVAQGAFETDTLERLPRHDKRKFSKDLLKWDDPLKTKAIEASKVCTEYDTEGRNWLVIDKKDKVKEFLPSYDTLATRQTQAQAIITDFDKDKFWAKVFTVWMEEGRLFKKEEVASFAANPKTANFTQLIWENTEKMGCSVTAFVLWSKKPPRVDFHAVCLYSPKGNVDNVKIYDMWTGIAVDKPCLDSEYILDMPFFANDTVIEDVVKKHNEYRMQVIDGMADVKSGAIPVYPFKDLIVNLTWDETLAESAQEIADNCDYEYLESPGDEDGVNAHLFDVKELFLKPHFGEDEPGYEFFLGNFTQYIWDKFQTITTLDNFWMEALEIWYGKRLDLDQGEAEKAFTEPEENEYIRMVNPATSKLGCGASLFRSKELVEKYEPKKEEYKAIYDTLIADLDNYGGGVKEMLNASNDIVNYTLAIVCRYQIDPTCPGYKFFSCPDVVPSNATNATSTNVTDGFVSVLSKSQMRFGLTPLNKFRWEISEGTVENFPKIEGLQKLEWNDTLMEAAMKYTSTCRMNKKYGIASISYEGLDDMRSFFSANETMLRKWIASGNPTKRDEEVKDFFNATAFWDLVLQTWENEKNLVDLVTLKPKYNNMLTGNFSQLVAKNNTEVGCAASFFIFETDTEELSVRLNFVCNYDEKSAVEGTGNEPPYVPTAPPVANTTANPSLTTAGNTTTARNATTTGTTSVNVTTTEESFMTGNATSSSSTLNATTPTRRSRPWTHSTTEVEVIEDEYTTEEKEETEPDESTTPSSPTGDTTYQPSSVTFKRRPLNRKIKCWISGSAKLQRFSVLFYLSVCYIAYRNLGMN